MTERATAAGNGDVDSTNSGKPVFAERLYVPWFHWILPLVAAALVAVEVHMGFPAIPLWLPGVLTVPLAVFAMVRLGRTPVRVQGGELWAADAHIPVRFIGAAEPVPAAAKRKTLGPLLDPTAFVVHRGWVPTMVRFELTDPADPTPYWLVSVRRPAKLIDAVRAEQDR